MRHSLFILISLAIFGCDSSPKETPSAPIPTSVTQTPEVAAVSTGPILIQEFKLQASQGVMLMADEMPGVRDIETAMLEALRAKTSFSKDAKRKAKGSAMLDVQSTASRVEVMLAGSVTTQDPEPQRYTAEVLVTDADIDDRRLKPLLDEAIRLFVKRIDAQVRVKSATNEQLIEILKGDEESAAKLVAVQESRDRRLHEAIDFVRPLLASTDARLQVASSAMLVSLKDTQSNGQIIEIAEHYSRESNPQMLPMLYIIADMGTDESKTYLNAVAEGHAVVGVRQVASEALNRQTN